MSLDWATIVAHALTLPDTEPATSYGKPAVKANGRAIVSTADDPGVFVLHLDRALVDMLMETDPDTYWQTPHYAGWPAVLVRYATDDPARVLAMVEASRNWAMTRSRPRRNP